MPNMPKTLQTLIIEHVEPELDGGRYPIKRIVGEKLDVTADIFKEGHDTIGAVLRYKMPGHKEWSETPMHHVDNDRWAGSFPLSENTRYLYSVGAYVRSFETWKIELTKKHGVLPDLSSELLEGEMHVKETMARAKGPDKSELKLWLERWKSASDQEGRISIALDPIVTALVGRHEHRDTW